MKKILILLFILLTTIFKSIHSFAFEPTDSYANYHIVDIDHPTPLEEIQNKYHAISSSGENITDSLTFKTDYNEQDCKVKIYELYITTQDQSYQSITQLDYIWVMDFQPPQIELDIDMLIHNLDTPLSYNDIAKHIKFQDNYDKEASNIIIKDFDSLVEVGEYQVLIYALDSSGNHSNPVLLPVTLHQTIFEVFLSDEIIMSNLKFTQENVLDLFLKENEIEANYDSISLKCNYFNHNKPGIYQMTISVQYKDYTYVYYGKLNVLENIKKEKSHVVLYIALGILVPLILISIIIYLKKKTN
ncbi:MAG: hypothetical protein K2I42_02550 [Anaeroplasmataceae bacterium]|nr:hypothetical protein [Anaeroplasmataceae bacterium]